MIRTKLAQHCSQQERFLRASSQDWLLADGQLENGQSDTGALRSKVLQSLKLLFIVIKLAEQLDNVDLWPSLQNLLLEGHSDLAQEQLRAGQLASRTIGRLSGGGSLLQAIACCYKKYLRIARKEMQDSRKADENAQHLARLSRSQTFPTKSYQQHREAAQRDSKKLQRFGGSDRIASLLARILARLLNPSCLPDTSRILMLDSGLPEAVVAAAEEAGYFDHCEVRAGRPTTQLAKQWLCCMSMSGSGTMSCD